MEFRKMVPRIYLQGSSGETDTENRLMDKGWGEEGEGEMNGKAAWMHIHEHMYIVASGNLLYDSGN